MALSDAEKHAHWRARRKQRITDLEWRVVELLEAKIKLLQRARISCADVGKSVGKNGLDTKTLAMSIVGADAVSAAGVATASIVSCSPASLASSCRSSSSVKSLSRRVTPTYRLRSAPESTISHE
jgi:hypothetical protein